MPKGARDINSRNTFVVKGYDCRKNALQRFGKHKNSAFHRFAKIFLIMKSLAFLKKYRKYLAFSKIC